MKGYVRIGKAGKAHGADGELNASIDDRFLEAAVSGGWLFVDIDGQAIPFFLEHIRSGKDLIIKLEDVITREDAAKLAGRPLLLSTSDMVLQEGDLPPVDSGLQFGYLTGFELRDVEMGVLGIIREVVEYPQQELARLVREGKELLIPLHVELIEEENREKKYILMRLPVGIVDL